MTALVSYCDVNSLPGGNGTTPATTGVNRAYSSQNEMEAAENKDFVAAGDSFTGIMSGGRDSESVIWAGGNTSALFDIVITTTTDRHNGVFDNTKYYMDVGQSTQVALNIQEDFFSTIGIPFNRQSIAASGVNRTCIRVNLVGAGVIKTEQCIFKSSAFNTAGVVSAIQIDDSSPNYTFKSNICYGFNGSTHTAVTGIGASATVEIYSNTFIDHSVGIQSRANYLCKNNVFQDCVTDISGTLNAGNDYNLTDNGSIAGANSVTSSTLTFENKTANNYALAAGDTDAIGAGIGPSSDANVPAVDVIGTARTGTATDIGAFMFVGGSSGISLTVDSLSSLQSLSNVSLVQSNSLSVDSVESIQDLTNVSFSESSTLAVNNIESIQLSSSPTFTQASVLSVNALTQVNSVSEVVLSVAGALSVNDISNTQGISLVSFLQSNLLAVDGLSSTNQVSNVLLDTGLNLIVSGLSSAQSISETGLTQHNILLTDPISNTQFIGVVSIGGEGQDIGTVTAGFADDKYSVKYGVVNITVKFKE